MRCCSGKVRRFDEGPGHAGCRTWCSSLPFDSAPAADRAGVEAKLPGRSDRCRRFQRNGQRQLPMPSPSAARGSPRAAWRAREWRVRARGSLVEAVHHGRLACTARACSGRSMSGACQPLIRLPGAADSGSGQQVLDAQDLGGALPDQLAAPQQIAHGARFTRIDIPSGRMPRRQVRRQPGIGCIAAWSPSYCFDRCRVHQITLPPADHRPASTS